MSRESGEGPDVPGEAAVRRAAQEVLDENLAATGEGDLSPSSRHRLRPASLPPLCQVDRDAIRQGQDRAMRLSAHLRAATRGACRHAECSDGSAQPTKTTTRSENERREAVDPVTGLQLDRHGNRI
jgi:hypothetical protein